MKKGKVISMPTSVEGQIRTRARNLPIDKCYVSNNWDEAQLATVVVSRKHVNGNVTYGIFLVDLLLKGVIECDYVFNEPQFDLIERYDDFENLFFECDYDLAHNIIYEGLIFGEENGFTPNKKFANTGIYLLEEDTDDIPEMDIPLGEDGMPVVFVTEDDDMKHEIAVLDKTVGEGNYLVYHLDDDDDDDDNDDDDDDDDDFFEKLDNENGFKLSEYMRLEKEIIKMGLDKFMEERLHLLTPSQHLALNDILYALHFRFDGAKESEEIYHLIMGDERFNPELENILGLENYEDSIQSIIDKEEDDPDASLSEMEALIAAHPDDVPLAMAQISLFNDLDMREKTGKVITDWYNRAPDNHMVRLAYAVYLMDQNRCDEIFEFFDNLPGLDAITKENVPFTSFMVANFCACYIMAWLSMDEINKAEPYYRLLLAIGSLTNHAAEAMDTISMKKKMAIVESFGDEYKK